MSFQRSRTISKIALIALLLILLVPFSFAEANCPGSNKMTETDAQRVSQYNDLIQKYAAQYEIPPELIKAVMTQESRGKPKVVSSAGAAGLMQFMPGTAMGSPYREIFKGDVNNRFDPEMAIHAGAAYLSDSWEKYNQNVYLIAISYNAGGRRANRIMARLGGAAPTWDNIDPLLNIKETRTYAQCVAEHYEKWGGVFSKTSYQGLAPNPMTTNDGLAQQTPEGYTIINAPEGYMVVNAPGGYAASQLETPVKDVISYVGLYAQKPSFYVELDYNIDDYRDLIDVFSQRETGIITNVKECERTNQGTIKECLAKEIEQLNSNSELKFSIGPCDAKEKVISDLAEGYHEATQSRDKECIYSFQIEPSTINKYPLDEMKITIDSTNSEVKFTIEGSDIIYSVQGFTTGESSIFYEAEFSGDSMSAEMDTTGLMPSLFGVDYSDNNIYLYRKDNKISFVSKSDYDSKSNLPQCSPGKRTFKFCVQSPYELPKYSKEEKKVSKGPVQYKFAIDFPDSIPPPPVTNLNVADKQKAERSFILNWDEPKEKDGSIVQDLKHYRVYCSKEPFQQIDNKYIFEGIRPLIVISFESEVNIDTDMCSNEDVAEDTPYYFAVAAEDYSENIGEPVIFGPVNSVDDLTPGKVFLTINGALQNVPSGSITAGSSLSWEKPELNEDEFTEYNDLAGYYIYFSTAPITKITQPSQISVSAQTTGYTITDTSLGTYVAVAAFDLKGNFISELDKPFTKPKQWDGIQQAVRAVLSDDEARIIYDFR